MVGGDKLKVFVNYPKKKKLKVFVGWGEPWIKLK